MRNLEVVPFSYGARRAPDYVDNVTIGTSAKAVTVPSSAAFVLFASDVNFYVRYSTTAAAALPTTAGDVTNGSGNELNPDMRYLYGATGLSIIGASTGAVSLAWYRG